MGDFLIRNVREEKMLSLEEAHWRLSKYPAQASGMLDRGQIAVGMPEEILRDQPANEWRRVRKSSGYKNIIVNGQITFEDGRCSGATPGKLLRHGVASTKFA